MTKPKRSPSPADLVGAYSDWMIGQGMSPNTVRMRSNFALARVLEWGTLDQSPSTVGTWLTQHNQWTRRTYYNHLVSLYAFLLERELVKCSPVVSMRRPPAPSVCPRVLAVSDSGERLAVVASIECQYGVDSYLVPSD